MLTAMEKITKYGPEALAKLQHYIELADEMESESMA
jgi:hypothetical protein